MARQGILVEPYKRLNPEQIDRLHRASMDILSAPGIVCYNREAAEIFGDNGVEVLPEGSHWILKIPEKVVMETLEAAPGVVKLGARDEENCLILDGA